MDWRFSPPEGIFAFATGGYRRSLADAGSPVSVPLRGFLLLLLAEDHPEHKALIVEVSVPLRGFLLLLLTRPVAAGETWWGYAKFQSP